MKRDPLKKRPTKEIQTINSNPGVSDDFAKDLIHKRHI